MNVRHRLTTVLLFFLLFPLLPLPADAAGAAPVRVAVYDYPNYFQIYPDGAVRGLAYEYLEKVRDITGWTYVYVPLSLAEALEQLKSGDIDLIPGVRRTPERAALGVFSGQPLARSGPVLCVLPHNQKYSFNDFAAYDGLRVATLRGSSLVEPLREFLARYGVTARFVTFETDVQCKDALENGDVDALLMDGIRMEERYRILARGDTAPIHFLCNGGRPDIRAALDAAQRQIHRDDPYYEMSLDRKYFGKIREQLVLTAAERRFIAESPPLTVAYAADMNPVEYYDAAAGRFRGISVDLLHHISQSCGLRCNLIRRGDAADTVNRIAAGELQIVGSMAHDREVATVFGTRLTDPLYSISLITIRNKHVQDVSRKSLRVILKRGYPLFEQMARRHGYTDIRYAQDFAACLAAVNAGESDLTLLTAYSMDRLMNRTYYKNILAAPMPHSHRDYSIAVSPRVDPLLISILNKGIAGISEETRRAIIAENLQINVVDMPLREFLAEHITTIFGGIIVFLCAVSAFAYRIAVQRSAMNRELRTAVRKSEEANVAKSLFVSRMSHDIRTPLNVIISLSLLSREEAASPRLRDDLARINTSSTFLLGLINDVLDVAKIESHKMTLHPQICFYDDFIREIRTLIEPLCAAKHITFVVEDAAAHPPLFIDSLRLKQIFFNLLSNAVKFTPEGGRIEFRMENTRLMEDGKLACDFVIQDNGIGMSPEFQKKIFQPFEQERAASTARLEGTGLGLVIVKNVVDLLGGQIHFASEQGKGTTFRVHLHMDIAPQALREAADPTTAPPVHLENLAGRRILLAEDHDMNVVVARRLLEKQGAVVEVAEDGGQATAMFAAAAPGHYDVILMDLRMPVMDGFQATRAIRGLARPDAQTIPIIALTADAFHEDREKALEAGMNDFLTKPIDPRMLFKKISELTP